MASTFLSSANTLLPSSTPSTTTSETIICPHIHNVKRPNYRITCKMVSETSSYSSPILTKRSLAICLTTSIALSLASKGFQHNANAAILEADDDDVELMEKVKKDRKKRLDRQVVINSSKKEAAYVQDVVYKLSKVGQAIENDDLTAASSVLGSSTDADWVKNANVAFTKLTEDPEEKTEVDAFNSSLASLISSVTQKDVKSSKTAFVSSASALEKWTALTGLAEQLKGL